MFISEEEFETKLVEKLLQKGWKEVLSRPTEDDLKENWKKILFDNNRQMDRLNNFPLTKGEMEQILSKVNELKSPLKINQFLNGKTISIKRDNKDDKLHFGKEISLEIYDPNKIQGNTKYQIVRQPYFNAKSKTMKKYRADLLLLINGMPVICIELKNSNVHISHAINQLNNYHEENVFTGIFSLVQVFVAMKPDEMVYFANYNQNQKFDNRFVFRWQNKENELINDWKKIADNFLSIPMAHDLISYFTVADVTDGKLKVMRSYQIYAAQEIWKKVVQTEWNQSREAKLGGFIWHTTGSGKTLTSFKTAQLIASSNAADKVIFVMDRIELGIQSHEEYNNFAKDNESVEKAKSANNLINLLKNKKDSLIVTSIQKLNKVSKKLLENTIESEKINNKRIVFIVDEAHRSTFGDMLLNIKNCFNRSVFFGFTGTPIHDENKKKQNKTVDIFGDELHRYSISDGIRDENVLGFDLNRSNVYPDYLIKNEVALKQADASSIKEALSDPSKQKVYLNFMENIDMAGYLDEENVRHKGIEDYAKSELSKLYETDGYQKTVVNDILDSSPQYSRDNKFHAIFATSSIIQACKYYDKFQEIIAQRKAEKKLNDFKVAILFDPSYDPVNSTINSSDDESNNKKNNFDKTKYLIKIIDNYNKLYEQNFSVDTFEFYKKDISSRLAHKNAYRGIEKDPEKQIDLLIVVNQMLTGFDSKWINTLYLDKKIEFENIIQALSRTNRLNGENKPFGIIKWYRYPHTMEKNIEKAIDLYSGNKSYGIRVDNLERNKQKINQLYSEIKSLFDQCGIENFEELPEEIEYKAKFAESFKELNKRIDSAKIQGFKWEELNEINQLNEKIFNVLLVRYKELFVEKSDSETKEIYSYSIDPNIISTRVARINQDYMNKNFQKFISAKKNNWDSSKLEQLENDVRKTFAYLSFSDQHRARILLQDIANNSIELDENASLSDILDEKKRVEKHSQIISICTNIGHSDPEFVFNFIKSNSLNEVNLNINNRFNNLINNIDRNKAKIFLEKEFNENIPNFKLNSKIDEYMRKFIFSEADNSNEESTTNL